MLPSGWVGVTSYPAKSMPGLTRCYHTTGRMPTITKTYIPSTMTQLTLNFPEDGVPDGGTRTSSSPADSPVSHTPRPGSDMARRTLDTFGRRCLGSYERFDRHGSWARMFSALLLGMEDWYSTRCRLTWKLKGTKYNRMYFQLQVSTHRTSETGSGLLLTPGLVEIAETPEDYQARQRKRTEAGLNQAPHPGNKYKCLTSQVLYSGMLLKTPSAMDAYSENLSKKEQKFVNSGTLAQEIQSGFVEKRWPGMLPTPQSRDEKNGSRMEDGRTQRKMEQGWSFGLNDLSSMGMLPTPTAISDAKGGCTRHNPNRQKDTLAHAMHAANMVQVGKTSQLNPRFVGEMMGFPPNWTELPFLNGATNP